MEKLTPPDPYGISRSPWRIRFIIVVLAFAAYVPTLKVGFLWDDHLIIENNQYLTSWTWQNVKHDFTADNTQGTGDNYFRPFQAFSHRIDYTLWGLNPFGYHLSDLLVHLANGILLYEFVLVLGFTPLVALMTSCLFVVNPIGIEQFIIPSGRTTPLSFFFILACILCLLRPGGISQALGLFSYVLALLTKEISVVTPLLVALVFTYKRIPWKRSWIQAPLLLLTGGYLLLREGAVHSVVGPLDPGLLMFFLCKVFPRILIHYGTLILFPWNLHSHRLIPHLSHVWYLYLAGWIAGIGWLLWKKNRIGLFCTGWFVVGLLPTIPVMMRGGFMLDHWGYDIAPAILLPVSLLFAKGCSDPRERLRTISFTFFFGIVIAWSLLVHLNVALRGTDEEMYRWALHFTTSSPIKYNLGTVLLNTGRPREMMEALNYFEEVHHAYPNDLAASNAVALTYWKLGQRSLALRIVEQLAKEHPQDALTQRNLAEMRKR